jgi:hypothetical protein
MPRMVVSTLSHPSSNLCLFAFGEIAAAGIEASVMMAVPSAKYLDVAADCLPPTYDSILSDSGAASERRQNYEYSHRGGR